jgi:hypothetical protein
VSDEADKVPATAAKYRQLAPGVHKLNYERNGDGSVTLTLRQPIEVELKPVSALKFRKPRARDLVRMDEGAGPRERNLILIAALANIPIPSADMLDGLDYLDAQDICSDFLDRSLTTGAG